MRSSLVRLLGAAVVALHGFGTMCIAGSAKAQTSPRVALVPSVTLTSERGRTQLPTEGLAQLLSRSVLRHRAMLVDLPVALAAKEFELANLLQTEQRLPEQANLTVADALLSASLLCNERPSLANTKLKVVVCELFLKLVPTDSGTVAHREVLSGNALRTAGVLASQGVTHLLTTGAALSTQLDSAIGKALQHLRHPPTVELSVTHLYGRPRMQAIQQGLENLRGVVAVNKVLQTRQWVQFQISLAQDFSVSNLAAAIDATPQLALSISFETPGVLGAHHDLAESTSRSVIVAAELPPSSVMSNRAARSLVVTGTDQLNYLEKTKTLFVRGNSGLRAASRLAQELNVPWLFLSSLRKEGNTWLTTFDLFNSATGVRSLSSRGTGNAPDSAFQQALTNFKNVYKRAWQDPKRHGNLWPNTPKIPSPVEVSGLQAYTGSARDHGLLALHNRTQSQITDLEVSFYVEGQKAGYWRAQASLPPGQSVEPALALMTLHHDTAPAVEVHLTYRLLGKVYSEVQHSVLQPAIPQSLYKVPYSDKELNLKVDRAHAMVRNGDQQGAIRMLNKLEAQFPTPTGMGSRLLGYLLLCAGQADEARERLSISLTSHRLRLPAAQRPQVRAMLDWLSKNSTSQDARKLCN